MGMLSKLRNILLASTLCTTLLSPAAHARDPCHAEGTCGEQNPAPTTQPPGPDTPPPTPGTQIADIYPALFMNFESLPNNQIHLEGWWDCANAVIPAIDDDFWCPEKPAPRTRGAYHKFVVMDNGPYRPNCETEFVFTKSPYGGGMETHCANATSVDLHEEELSWTRLDSWRNFENENGEPGATWARRNMPSGEFYAERGMQHYRTCSDINTSIADYAMFNNLAVYGPYDISTPEGLSAAERELAQYTPIGYDIIEPGWKTFNTQIPGGRTNDHVLLWARVEGWGLKPGRSLDEAPGLIQWSKGEVFIYALVTGPTLLDDPKRGLPVSAWRGFATDDNGGRRFLRQAVFDRVVVDNRPSMHYGSCKNTPTILNATIFSDESAPLRSENRAAAAYNWGHLSRGLSEQDERRLNRLYRHANQN